MPIRTYFYTLDTGRLHWHQEMELLLVLKGSIHVLVQNVTHTVCEGEVIVISPNLIHATQQTEKSNKVLVVQMQCGRFGFHDTQIDHTQFDCCGGADKHPQIAAIRKSLCAIMMEMTYKRPGYSYAATAHTQHILLTLLRYFPHRVVGSAERTRAKDHARIQRIFAYIGEHHTQRITLRDLADREYLSVNHMSMLIKKTIGMGFGEYVNSVRMRAFLERLQSDMETPVETIAEQCGFSSPQYASALFAKAYKTTPGKYRRQLFQKNAVRQSALEAAEGNAFAVVYQPTDMDTLLRYWQDDKVQRGERASFAGKESKTTLDASAQGDPYAASCVRIAAMGRAYEGLLAHVQEALANMQREIGYTHIRFHGIFSDDMMILKVDNAGAIHYGWRQVDMLLDFLLSIRLRPFVGMSFMPTLLASGADTVFAWQGNITQPVNIRAWTDLVYAFVSHCVRRYGKEEVSGWYFEVWNEPDCRDISWAGTETEYFRFYAHTARAIKQALPSARVCGPSITSVGILQRRWASGFAEYCLRHDVPVDVFTLHVYPEVLDADNLYDQLQEINEQRDMLMLPGSLLGQDYVQTLVDTARRQLGASLDVPIIATEWNLTMATFSPLNDSSFAATAMLHTATRIDGPNVRLAHWTTLDYMEEQNSLPPQEFHGGYGLTTTHGIRKPTFWAAWALSRLRGDIVRRLDDGIAVREGAVWRLLLYNHPATSGAYDMVFTQLHRQEIMQQFDSVCHHIQIQGMGGTWRVCRHLFDAARCDAKVIAHAQGFAEPLADDAIEYLRCVARPLRSEANIRADAAGTLCLRATLPPCSFELIECVPVDPFSPGC